MSREAVICGAARTAIAKRNGSLADCHPFDLSADVLNAVLARLGIEPDVVEVVIWGCVSQVGDQSSNVARYAVLAAGWPDDVPGARSTARVARASSPSSLPPRL